MQAVTALSILDQKYGINKRVAETMLGDPPGMPVPEAIKTGERDDNQNADLPPTVAELKKILARAPIKVRATAKRTSVLAPDSFRNDDLLKRVSHLVFYDKDCWSFLYDHPEDIIDGQNFMSGCGEK